MLMLGFDLKENVMNQYYEGRKINISNGYQEVYFPEHHRARKSGNVHVHILVAEKILGRLLLDNEVVHHIDENKLNNDENNIMIFASQADHACYHAILRYGLLNFVLYRLNGVYHCKSDLDVFQLNECLVDVQRQYDNAATKKIKYKLCPNCGNVMYKQAKLCKSCRYLNDRVVERPSRNVLKQELRQSNFCSIARKYGVTDNAVRKWCRFYNLPDKASIIKSLSAQDWKKI